VLVLPSRFDGWGVVLNEGASMGLALISTGHCGAAYHLIQPGENGIRVNAGSVESLAAAMAAYTRNPELAAKHGRESVRISREYSPERNAKRFVAALETWQAQCASPLTPSAFGWAAERACSQR
jgi:glycosyltransferase involved in cell wall biosynthesis